MIFFDLAIQAPTRLKLKIGNSIRDFQGGKGGMYLLQAGLVNHFNSVLIPMNNRNGI